MSSWWRKSCILCYSWILLKLADNNCPPCSCSNKMIHQYTWHILISPDFTTKDQWYVSLPYINHLGYHIWKVTVQARFQTEVIEVQVIWHCMPCLIFHFQVDVTRRRHPMLRPLRQAHCTYPLSWKAKEISQKLWRSLYVI